MPRKTERPPTELQRSPIDEIVLAAYNKHTRGRLARRLVKQCFPELPRSSGTKQENQAYE